MEIKTKKDYHLFRKLGHLAPGLILVFFLEFDIFRTETIKSFFLKTFIIVLIFEFLRLRLKFLNKIFVLLFHKFIRKKEINEYSGVLTYLFGIIFVLSFFEQKIACLSILFLSFGDPFAALSGLFFSNKEQNFKIYKNKTIMGFIGMTMICTLVSLVYLSSFYSYSIQDSFFIGFFGGMVASIAETFFSEEIDDNLLIPVASSIAIYFLTFSF